VTEYPNPERATDSEGIDEMEYRRFGKTAWKVSALGFGCMRFPTTDGKPLSQKIDRPEATRMVRHAIDHGVNYLDTAYPYHGGKSEVLLGNILKAGYRERVKLATKSPIWLIKKGKDFDTYLNEQLTRLQTDYVDFYLFHGLNKKSWQNVVLKHGLLKRAEAAVKAGKIRNLGFSFHDDYSAFKEIVDGYDGWSLCQIQYNYMDTENQAGTKGLKYAASKGLAVVVMEPLLGGRLANPPKPIKTILKNQGKGIKPSDLALQWLWNQPEVSVVLSGMTTMGQVRENLKSANMSRTAYLGKDRLKLMENIKKRYRELVPIPCTRCNYCMPCPNGVNIPRIFEEYIDGFIHDDVRTARSIYSRFLKKEEQASQCKACKRCEAKCPQKIPISELMPKVHGVLGKDQPYPELRLSASIV